LTIDGNHPFAGKTPTYALTVADIRDASEEEKRNGVARPLMH
jgi:FKBP-type peptidyl-prolyl cis-trans isomerase 2